MVDRKPGEAGQASARRRLIRGAFSAPVALTLYSGGSAAAASNALRCLANQAGAPFPLSAGPTTAADALWVRVQLWELNQGGISRWVYGGDLALLTNTKIAASPYLSSGEWHCVFAENGSGYTAGVKLVQSTPPTKGNATAARANLWAAIKVDSSTGQIIGVYYNDTGSLAGTPAACSCWTSLTGIRFA